MVIITMMQPVRKESIIDRCFVSSIMQTTKEWVYPYTEW